MAEDLSPGVFGVGGPNFRRLFIKTKGAY